MTTAEEVVKCVEYMSIQDDIRNGESDILEFKQELPQKDSKLLKTVVAFANGYQGGRILFGVQDDGQINGVDIESIAALKDNLINMISEACVPQIYVTLSVTSVEDKMILVAEIPHGHNTPYYLKKEGLQNGTYVRIGATTRRAEQEKLEELILEGNNRSYDSVVDREAKPANTEDIQALSQLIHSYLGDGKKPVTAEHMVGWRLLQRKGEQLMPTVAFRLLTRNDIYFARVQCGAFAGTTTDVFLDKKELCESVCEQLEQAQNFILRHINTGAVIDNLHRTNVYEIPIPAIREALSNAILHRNYLTHANIRVAVFEDRVEIFSPGALYGITRQEMMSGCSSLRNPILADVFHKMNIVEKWGSGIRRMCHACDEAGIPRPDIAPTDTGVMVTFHRTKQSKLPAQHTPTQKTIVQSLSANQNAVLTFLRENPNATYLDICSHLQLSRDSVKWTISKLKAKSLIERIGGDKSGSWRVLE